MIVLELIINDMKDRLAIEDWIALGAVASMMTTPYLIVAYQNIKEAIIKKINARLACHGLRVKRHVKN